MSGAQNVWQLDRVYSVVYDNGARPEDEVPASRQRSAANYKIDQASDNPPRVLTATELKDYRERVENLIAIARDELDSLYRIVWRARYVVLLSNERGVTIDHRGEQTEAARFSYWGTWIGGIWSEETEGTNGIGTCIAEGRPVTVHRTQHFRLRHVNLSCSVAPIFGIRGELIGTLDISSIDPDLSEQSRGLAESLVIETARAIQERYFREQFRGHWIVAVAERDATDGAILLAVDKDHQIVGADRNARVLLSQTNTVWDSPVDFWTLFQRDERIFGANECASDISVRLVRVGRTAASSALITRPETPAAVWRNSEITRLHCRPRLNIVTATPQAETSPRSRGGLPPMALRRVQEYIDQNLDDDIGLGTLAAIAGLSLHHFARAFKVSAGVPPHGYVLQQRLNKARDLLIGTGSSLADIALVTGFSDQSHLARQFRQSFGISPGNFRRSHR
jgi:transcriptional regulator of acetoin/glycerol metabolism/AraC-like DNA-binding protein